MTASRISFACQNPSYPLCPVGSPQHPCLQESPEALVVVEALPLCRDDEGAELLLSLLSGPQEPVIVGDRVVGEGFCRGFAVMPCADAFKVVQRFVAASPR